MKSDENKNPNLTVKKIRLYGVKSGLPVSSGKYVVEHLPGNMDGPHMRDERIQAKESNPKTGVIGRGDLKDDQGNLCIGVQPGDEYLGEFYLSVQFEGPSGKHEICMAGQNELLRHTSRNLQNIMEEMGFVGEVDIDGEPCPERDSPPIKVIQAAQNLEGVSPSVDLENEVTNQVKNEVRQ